MAYHYLQLKQHEKNKFSLISSLARLPSTDVVAAASHTNAQHDRNEGKTKPF